MRTLRAALLLMLSVATCRIAQAQTEHHLTAAEAKNHVGETATVCGRVASIHFAEKTKGLPTFLNVDKPYPNQIFAIVIWGTDRPKFGKPEATYRDKQVCVIGKITSHREIPLFVGSDCNPEISAYFSGSRRRTATGFSKLDSAVSTDYVRTVLFPSVGDVLCAIQPRTTSSKKTLRGIRAG